jgi:hypothetical protein
MFILSQRRAKSHARGRPNATEEVLEMFQCAPVFIRHHESCGSQTRACVQTYFGIEWKTMDVLPVHVAICCLVSASMGR